MYSFLYINITVQFICDHTGSSPSIPKNAHVNPIFKNGDDMTKNFSPTLLVSTTLNRHFFDNNTSKLNVIYTDRKYIDYSITVSTIFL